MACTAIEELGQSRENRQWIRRLLGFIAEAVRWPSRLSRLDLEILPDHLKRDLGFMDGRDPRYEDERAR